MEKVIKPEKLEKGDTIALVAPSKPIDIIPNARFDIKKSFDILKRWGYKIKKMKHLTVKNYLTAGNPEDRANDINRAFEDPNVKMILTVAGGFLSNEVLPYIDFNIIRKNPKIFCGMSDISTLLNPITSISNLVSFHGPTLLYGRPDIITMFYEKYDRDYFFKAVSKAKPIGKIEKLSEWYALRKGVAKGQAMGGNLTVVTDLIGTKYEPEWKNKILFLEEIDEDPEKIIHDLTKMKLSGVFKKISGLVFGHFEKCWSSEPSLNAPLDVLLKQFFKGYDFPILKIEEFGHDCPNITIPFGCNVTVDANRKILTIDEAAVV